MIHSLFRATLPLVFGFGALVAIAAQTPVRVPLDDFFAEADCTSMQLSPDGRHVAFLTMLGYGKVGVALMELATGKVEPLVSARDENIKEFFWKGSEHIVFGGDVGGAEFPAWRSIPIALPKGGGKRRVVSLSEALQERINEDALFMQIIDRMKYDPVRLLVFGRQQRGGVSSALYYVDVRTGRRSNVGSYLPPSGLNEYAANADTFNLADNNGILRARQRVEGKRALVEVRPEPTGPYVRVAEFPAETPGWGLLFFAADNETLYLFNAEKTDTPALHTYNVRTGQMSGPLFHHPTGEITNVLMSWDRSTVYGVNYLTDRARYHFFDASREKLQQLIDASLPHTFNQVVGMSHDEQTLLLFASTDRDPGTYYLLDRAHGRLKMIAKQRSRIDPARMQPMESVNFSARDGLTVHGYLTRPTGPAGQRVPLIILPHGGPYGIRDTWGFNPEVQFLANRGYAVLQVNYRGSGGYGSAFEQAGYQEWGGKMQDDLSDAVHWAIAEGVADPERVAIYGASYGGYAALAGLVFTPELYCCGANYVGVSDLALQVGLGKNSRGDGNQVFFRELFGDKKEYLQARSPVNHIERLRVPLFNAYGFNDPRVDFRHWTRLEAKLKQFNKDYEIVVEKNEGHGFDNEKSRVAFYRRLEAFFERHLAPVRSARSNPTPIEAAPIAANKGG